MGGFPVGPLHSLVNVKTGMGADKDRQGYNTCYAGLGGESDWAKL